jgi:hypothetical protein
MNQKIKELAGAALDLAVPETWSSLSPEQLEKFSDKFARLIIQDCVAICISNALEELDTITRPTSAKCGFDINEYFGITS